MWKGTYTFIKQTTFSTSTTILSQSWRWLSYTGFTVCWSTDMLKYFRESLGIRDNESRLYFICSVFILFLCTGSKNIRLSVQAKIVVTNSWGLLSKTEFLAWICLWWSLASYLTDPLPVKRNKGKSRYYYSSNVHAFWSLCLEWLKIFSDPSLPSFHGCGAS